MHVSEMTSLSSGGETRLYLALRNRDAAGLAALLLSSPDAVTFRFHPAGLQPLHVAVQANFPGYLIERL